jgi:hypothetical protein
LTLPKQGGIVRGMENRDALDRLEQIGAGVTLLLFLALGLGLLDGLAAAVAAALGAS